MKTFEIMFDDLTEEAQRQFLEFQGLEDSKDGNYDIVPIAVIELEDDCFDSDDGWPVRARNARCEQKHNEYVGLKKRKERYGKPKMKRSGAVLVHYVCFNVPPRYIENQFDTEIIAESG